MSRGRIAGCSTVKHELPALYVGSRLYKSIQPNFFHPLTVVLAFSTDNLATVMAFLSEAKHFESCQDKRGLATWVVFLSRSLCSVDEKRTGPHGSASRSLRLMLQAFIVMIIRR